MQVPYGDGWDIGGSQPVDRTRNGPAIGCRGGVYCRRDTIHPSWLVHLGSDPILGRGFAQFRRMTVSAAASFLRQKIGKQIAPLAPREMAHIVWDGKRYDGKTRQPVCGRYLPPNSTDPGW
jgi:hypothetical protein